MLKMLKAMCVCILLIRPTICTFSNMEGAIIAVPQDKLNWFQIALVKSVFLILVIQWLTGTLPVVVSLPLKNFVPHNKLGHIEATATNGSATIPPPATTTTMTTTLAALEEEEETLSTVTHEKKPAEGSGRSRRRLEMNSRKAFHLFHIVKRIYDFIYFFVRRYILVVPGILRWFRPLTSPS